jgi:hypothetical protein
MRVARVRQLVDKSPMVAQRCSRHATDSCTPFVVVSPAIRWRASMSWCASHRASSRGRSGDAHRAMRLYKNTVCCWQNIYVTDLMRAVVCAVVRFDATNVRPLLWHRCGVPGARTCMLYSILADISGTHLHLTPYVHFLAYGHSCVDDPLIYDCEMSSQLGVTGAGGVLSSRPILINSDKMWSLSGQAPA